MAKANCPIYEMQVKRVSLEDVFLELTEGEKKSAGKPESSQWKPVEDRSSEKKKLQEEKTGNQRRLLMRKRGSVMTAIFKRELKSYLTSMVGYLFIFLSWC